MRRNRMVLTLASIAVIAAGCGPKEAVPPGGATNAEGRAAARYEEAKEETKEAVKATQEYAYAQKEAFVAATEKQMASMKTETAALRARLAQASAEARAEGEAKLKALEDQTKKLDEHLAELKASTETTWDKVKGGFDTAYKATQESFNDARTWLSEKIRPN